MGDAKRKRQAIENSSCRCGSGNLSKICCYKNHSWHKRPTAVDLRSTAFNDEHKDCYLRELKNCSSKISREHLVSKSVLDVIEKTGLVVGGFHWLPKDQEASIGKASLVAKCLCQAHNSALSPLDSVAGKFFSAIEMCDLNRTHPQKHFLFSGHDIERWCLKTLLAMANSNNLSRDGTRLPPRFHPKINPISLLENPKSWPWGAGLYFSQKLGDEFTREDNFHLAPITKIDTHEIAGLQVKIQGISFSFFALAPDVVKNSPLEKALYRPGKLIFDIGKVTNSIELSWEDNAAKHGAVKMTLTATVGDRAKANAKSE